MQEALRQARQKAGLTQIQVAKKAGVTERVYQYYEAGERVPNVYTAIRIAKAVKSTPQKIFPLK